MSHGLRTGLLKTPRGRGCFPGGIRRAQLGRENGQGKGAEESPAVAGMSSIGEELEQASAVAGSVEG